MMTTTVIFKQVNRSDMDVFEALACDSFTLKDDRMDTGALNDEDRRDINEWTQEKPGEKFFQDSKTKGPPILPPHLLQVRIIQSD